MKKILIFSTAYFPLVGGAEVAVKEITGRLPDFQFDLITARMDIKLSKFERIGNINVYRVGWGLGSLDKLKLPTLGWLKAKRLNRKRKYDLIWSIMASQASVAASFFKMSRPKTKLLLTLQEGDEEKHLKRYVLGNDFLYKLLIRPWHYSVFKKADFITAISHYLKERALKNNVKCPIEIVPNAVDIKEFSKIFSESELDGLREKLGKKPGDKFIIHTGRSVLKNALDDIIKALQYLPDNIKFLVVGGGSDDEKLKKLANDLGINDRVLFLGFFSHDQMVKYLKISDVFVRPSLSEGLGSSFLEAMAAGVPIIGTSVGGIPDFLFAGETGLFCEVKNPSSIAEKIKLILSDENLRQKLINNGRQLVEQNYDWNSIAQKMKDIFNKLTANS